MLALIVALANNRAIGRNNDLLWHISDDLKYFKKVTMGSIVIMGRKTFESIGERPLPGRRNIVITRNSRWEEKEPEEGKKTALEIASSLNEAISKANKHNEEGKEIFIIGGGQIYADSLEMVDRLYITEVDVEIEDADTYFPDFDKTQWEQENVSETNFDQESGYNYKFVTYKRR